MNINRGIVCTVLVALTGCSAWQENAYNAAQNYTQLQCQKNPTADCAKGQSYQAYQQQLKSDNPDTKP